MPTYDYRCGACGKTFEHFQSIHAPKLKKCPKCGKPKLERLIGGGGGLLFKGSGFYITDYRSSSYQEAAKKDAAPGAPAPAATPGSDGAAKASEPKSGAGDGAKPAPTPAPKAPPPAPKSPATKPTSSKGGGKGSRSH
jgi:putative FmdB family regulatory protein